MTVGKLAANNIVVVSGKQFVSSQHGIPRLRVINEARAFRTVGKVGTKNVSHGDGMSRSLNKSHMIYFARDCAP